MIYDVRIVWCQRIVELAMTSISKNKIYGLQTHTAVFDGDALFVLSLEGVTEETDGKVNGRGPHAVSVYAGVRIIFAEFGSSQRTETPS